jgi:hypothetical protein
LKLEDFLALPSDLDAHVLDFGTDVMGKASRQDQPYHRVTDISGLKAAGLIKGGQAPNHSGRRAGPCHADHRRNGLFLGKIGRDGANRKSLSLKVGITSWTGNEPISRHPS